MKRSNNISRWFTQIVIAGAVAILVLFLIPSEPNSTWLLGYSRTRWAEIGLILAILAALGTARYFITTDLREKASRFLQACIPCRIAVEVLTLLTLLALFSASLWGIMEISSAQSVYREAVIRAAPVAAFMVLFVITTILHLSRYLYSPSGDTRLSPPLRLVSLHTFRTVVLPWVIDGFQKVIDRLDNAISRAADRLDRRLLALALVALPAAGTILLLRLLLGSGISDYFPTRFDDVDYWRQTYSYVEHSLNFGQYSSEELVAPAEFSRFGLHGPTFPILYGLAGKLIGWRTDTAVWLNLILITAGLAGYVLIARPDNKQLLATILFAISFWPIWLYIPRNMQEIVHYALGFVLAGLWVRQLAKDGKPGKWLWLTVAAILFLSVVRFTWSLVLLGPFLTLWKVDKKWIWLRVAAWIAVFFACGILFTWWNVPWPTFSFTFYQALKTDPSLALTALWNNFLDNLRNLAGNPEDGWYVVAFRYQFTLLFIISVAAWFRAWRRKDSAGIKIASNLAAVVAPVYLLVIVLNNMVDTRDYRNLAPHLLAAALILILTNRHRWVYALILLNLIAVGSFGQRFASYKNAYRADAARQASAAFAEAVDPYLIYDPSGNRWCNALNIEYQALSPDMEPSGFRANQFLLIDPGIGLGFVTNWDTIAEQGLKSRYLFIDPTWVDRNYPGMLDQFDLTPLTGFEAGVLYLNNESLCGRSAP